MSALVIPVIALMALAVVIPRLLAWIIPEGVRGLIVNFALSFVALTALATTYFVWSYAARDTRVFDLIGVAPVAGIVHFVGLGLSSGLIWAPVLILSVSALPRHWKVEKW
ncbi:hypothetical protein [Oceaniglobus roseus]|uniref:hypothetical protein n=1 Tax=Oceaniglobus roseus TaxID=1737570 RepID=UPI000C7EFF13|nr:hypothetical protein [Kandeliimicrobium roseum]